METKKIELWEGYEVEFNEQLLDDFDFVSEFQDAKNKQDLARFVSMYFALVGGEEVFKKVREHIIAEKGHFSQDSLLAIIDKINAFFPKAGNPVEKRSWQTTK